MNALCAPQSPLSTGHGATAERGGSCGTPFSFPTPCPFFLLEIKARSHSHPDSFGVYSDKSNYSVLYITFRKVEYARLTFHSPPLISNVNMDSYYLYAIIQFKNNSIKKILIFGKWHLSQAKNKFLLIVRTKNKINYIVTLRNFHDLTNKIIHSPIIIIIIITNFFFAYWGTVLDAFISSNS